MREKKRSVAAAVLAAAVALGLVGCGDGSYLDQEDLEIQVDGGTIRPGMSREEVESILGEPTRQSYRDSTEYLDYDGITISYAVPVPFDGTDDELDEASIVHRILVSGDASTSYGVQVGATKDSVSDAYSGINSVNYHDITTVYPANTGWMEFRFNEDGNLDEYTITQDFPDGYAAVKSYMRDEYIVTPGQVGAISVDPTEETPATEPEPAGIAELTEKISVTMEQVERMPDGTEKVNIRVYNNSNETLEYAELFVVITSDSEGDLFMQSYTIEDLLPWRGQTDTVFVDYTWDMELYYEWDENYRFSEAVETPTGGVEDEASSQTYYDALKADTLIDWRDPVTDVQYMRDGDYDWLVITFTHDVDPIAAEKIDGFKSIANVASVNGYGGLFPDRVVLQYEDGTVILEKDAL